MFFSTFSFNRDISDWDVSRVTDMDFMFAIAVKFKQRICGSAWVHSQASKQSMFAWSYGSISKKACTSTSVPTAGIRQYVTRRPITERELVIVRTQVTTPVGTPGTTSMIPRKMRCSKCGTFKKSGRHSCCAPGGAWYKTCGGAGNRNADHRWFEGLKACKCKSKAKDL